MAQQQVVQKRLVRVFYLGGLAPDEKAYPISVGTRVFRLPPIGDYIEVSEFYATELIAKFKVIMQNGIYDAFTTDPRIADQAKAVKEGRVKAPPKPAAAMSNDELLALLKERGVEVASVATSTEAPPEEELESSVIEAEQVVSAPKTRKTKSTQE